MYSYQTQTPSKTMVESCTRYKPKHIHDAHLMGT